MLSTLVRKISTSFVQRNEKIGSSLFLPYNFSKKPYPIYRMGYNPNIKENPKYKEIVVCVKDYSTIYYKFVKVEVK